MNQQKRLCTTGYITFFLSGICTVSSGIIVSLLQEQYGFSYGMTGTLLALLNIGNMTASFLSGIMGVKLGMRKTVMILGCGYFLGYGLMTMSSAVWVLSAAFFIVGITRGCVLNNCNVLVGNNSANRARGMSILHAVYASGALVCPFVIAAFASRGTNLSILLVAVCGALMWTVFMLGGLPGKKEAAEEAKEKGQFDFMRDQKFWLLTALLFCQIAAETSVTGWFVTYYKDAGILSGSFSNYTVTIMWTATLIARLLIAFVFPIKNTFKALSVMGLGCTVMYGGMIFANTPVPAIVLLFVFAFSIAGVNPVAIAAIGKEMSPASMGVMLPVGSIGGIVMPWIIGKVADGVSLQAGMACNLAACVGVLILSMILYKKSRVEVTE